MDGEWSPQHRLMRPSSSQPRHPSLRRTVLPVAVLAGALRLIAGTAQAALPPNTIRRRARTGTWRSGSIRRTPRRSRRSSVYSQQCKGTIAKTGVPISDAGVIAASGGLKGYGWWEVNATVNEPTTIVGTMRMRRADCDTGVLSYPNAITGDGRTDHAHAGGGHTHGSQYADFGRASLAERKQARALHRRVLKTWWGITPARAKLRGFHRPPGSKPVVGFMYHMYNQRYERDSRLFEGKRPESLVFWRRASGDSVILGPRFRVPAGKRPSFAGPIPIYHGHASATGEIPNQMTHVWMTKGPKMAWANCLPVFHLQQYNPVFKWTPDTKREHIGEPCK